MGSQPGLIEPSYPFRRQHQSSLTEDIRLRILQVWRPGKFHLRQIEFLESGRFEKFLSHSIRFAPYRSHLKHGDASHTFFRQSRN